MEKPKKPLFEENAAATLNRVTSTFGQRGQEYGDTWRETEFVKMQAVARLLGIKLTNEQCRLLATAGFCDMKYWRNLGGYKDDSIVDGIAYDAFLAEEIRKLQHPDVYSAPPTKPTLEIHCIEPGCHKPVLGGKLYCSFHTK